MMGDFYGLPQGVLILAMGPPGTGKSYFAGSVCDVVDAERVALLCTKPKEVGSYQYVKNGLSDRAEVFYDPEWDPEFDERVAVGWKMMNKRLRELRHHPDYDAVILDPGTDAMVMLSHDIMSSMGIDSMSDLRETGGKGRSYTYYGEIAEKVQRFVTRLAELTLPPHPKFVIVPWHVQSATDDEQSKGKGTMFEGTVLPMLPGQYRQKLAGDANEVVYTEIVRGFNSTTRMAEESYVLRVAPTPDKHAKLSSVPRPDVATIGNNFAELLALLTNSG